MHRVRPPGAYRPRGSGSRLAIVGVSRRTRAGQRRPAAPGPAGICLTQLTRMARLTPQQALVIAAEVVSELDQRREAGTAVGGVDEHNVWVGFDGQARLVDTVSPAAPEPGAVEPAGASARSVLAHLGRVLADGDRTGEPATALTSAIGLDGGIAASATALRSAAAPSTGRARSELAALVTALTGGPNAPSTRSPTPPTTPRAQPPAAPEPARRAPLAALARGGRWFLAALVLIGLIALELALFGNRIEADLATLHAAGRPAATPGAVPTPVPAPAPPPLPVPTANGPVTKVDLRPLASCEPGQACQTRLQVWLRPGTGAQQVGWTFQVTDRCTGATWQRPGGSMKVGENGDQLSAVTEVDLPAGQALALTAVLAAPAPVASPTLLLPADATCAAPR
ncbi:hypothetical protein [Pseudonocardia acaciae]|uniref:hypothetical protein n=1 Tax=Pseudonocardia acaciae TaxID=551276 RepID=UPI0012ECFC98|nr:hypothetical protein [Pseudonocardia acaciae]